MRRAGATCDSEKGDTKQSADHGGDPFEATAIHNQLRAQSGDGRRVEVWIDGIAASAATIITSAGRIAYRQSSGSGPAIVLVHGNSASSRAFARQLDGPLGAKYRIIAPDLPGHGGSADAADPGAAALVSAVLANVTREMKITYEETFGPVAPLFRFKTEQELIERANDTEYGLASYFYSRDIGRIWRVAEALEYGMVGINAGIISNEIAPFGGVKESGIGREGSRHGVEDFLEMKYLAWAGVKDEA